MNEDDNKPVRLVVNNSNEISDLSTLEISVPFGEMAAQINECLADGSSKGLFASVLAFVEACREAELKAEEVDALLSTLPNFSTGAPVNDPIDTVLRGAVRMAAAIHRQHTRQATLREGSRRVGGWNYEGQRTSAATLNKSRRGAVLEHDVAS
jgi:hypothetical protein